MIGTEEPDYTTPYDLNIIGEYNLSGELWQVKPLLDELGIRIFSCISGDGKYREVAYSHRARAAMMVCSKAMINVARKMEERYGIPFFEGSFYGIQDSSDSLREIARLLIERGAPDELMARTEAVIAREEARAWAAIEPYKPRFNGKKVLLITGGVKSWSVVAALQEAGLELVGTSVKKSTKEDKERIKELMGQDAHMIDDMTPREMYKMLKDAKADIMLSGGKSQFVALKAAMPWLDINQERSHAYMGYVGMVKLVEEIDKALFNPVWEQLRQPAPWEKGAKNWQARAIAQMDAEAAALAADPEAAEKARRAKKICNCKTVDLGTIEDAIHAHGLTTSGRRQATHQRFRRMRRLRRKDRGYSGGVAGADHLGGSCPPGGGVGRVMATVTVGKKACAVNPLKMSQPIGGAFAFMGLRGSMPLLHGSQGCTSFGLTLFVRHFKEAVPLQTTAMSEVATVLGGYENVEQAVLNIYNRTKPEIIGICSTGVTETKGDDVEGYLRLIREKHPQLAAFPMVYVPTPDFKDAFQDGWEKTVARMIEVLVETPKNAARRDPSRVNVLPGCHLTPGDLDELRTILEDFGLEPSFLPDLAGSLDGHIPDEFVPTTIGGIGVDEVAIDGAGRLDHCRWRADAARGGGHGEEDGNAFQAVRAPVWPAPE